MGCGRDCFDEVKDSTQSLGSKRSRSPAIVDFTVALSGVSVGFAR